MTEERQIDVFEAITELASPVTKHYLSDLKIDKSVIEDAYRSHDNNERVLLWMCRTHGTECFKESNVFMKDSYANVAWQYQAESMFNKYHTARAYTLVLEDRKEIGGEQKIYGRVYPLDLREQIKRVQKNAVCYIEGTDCKEKLEACSRTEREIREKRSPLSNDDIQRLVNKHNSKGTKKR